MQRIDYDLGFMLKFENIAWYERPFVKILDRRIYPNKVNFVICRDYKEVAKAIKDMVTQSAGPYTAASMGMALAAYECRKLKKEDKIEYLIKASEVISNARPTTRIRMKEITDGCVELAKNNISNNDLDNVLFEYSLKLMENRYKKIEDVAKHFINVIPSKGSILTQCYGETIVGMMLREIKKHNKDIKIFCAETRPFLQGARFTASVAIDMGFDTTVITDNMVGDLMSKDKVDIFTSAADTITRDGYVVNKVGTLQYAICAKYFKVPYFVTGIVDKIESIKDVEIEYRDPFESISYKGVRNTKEGVKGYYPAFDITSPDLISGIVTDHGIFSPYDLKSYNSNNGFYSFAV